MSTRPRRLALIDRDGTLVKHHHHLHRAEDLELLPGTGAGLRALRSQGFALAIVTNQSVVGRGLVSETGLSRIHDRLRELLASDGASIDAIHHCPHRPDEGCPCRKPAPGLAHRALADFACEAEQSVVIGDAPCDVELADSLGARPILVRTGRGATTERELKRTDVLVADDLEGAARLIATAPARTTEVDLVRQ